MYCKNCGYKNNDNVNYCFSCGSNLKNTPPKTPVSYTSQNQAQTPIIQNNNNIPIEAPVSYFDGGLLQKIGWIIVGIFITVLTLGICYPWACCLIYEWEAKHTVIEGKRLRFNGTAVQLFGNWMLWWFLIIITLGIYLLWIPIQLKKWKTKHTYFDYYATGVQTTASVYNPTNHSMKKCNNCGYYNTVYDNFCKSCGVELPKYEPTKNKCNSCGYENVIGSDFCKNCGTKL